jgi:hypothetical protein
MYSFEGTISLNFICKNAIYLCSEYFVESGLYFGLNFVYDS